MIKKIFPSKRNPSIELYRLLGSLIVIGVHCISSVPNQKKEKFENKRKVVECFFFRWSCNILVYFRISFI